MAPTDILIVEDDLVIRKTLVASLRRGLGDGQAIEECSSAKEALGVLSARRFAVVISDLRLPGMSGLELLSQIRSSFPETRTVLITGYGSDQVEAQAHQLQAAYLPKPFDPSRAVRLVQGLLSPPIPDSPQAQDAQGDLMKSLCDLRVQVGATYVMLVDLEGNTILDSGSTADMDHSALNALIGAGMATSTELGRALKEEHAWDLHYHDGQRFQVYSIMIGEATCLSLLFPTHPQASKIGNIWFYLKRTAGGIREKSRHLPWGKTLPASRIGEGLRETLNLEAADTLFSADATDDSPSSCSPGSDKTITAEEAVRRGLLPDTFLVGAPHRSSKGNHP